MCMTCGCVPAQTGQPDDDHGDARNLTESKFRAAADAQGISLGQVVQNVNDTYGLLSIKTGGTAGMIRKSFQVLPGTTKVLDPDQGIVEAWVNTTAVMDLQNDVMEPGCWGNVIKSADAGEVDRPSTVWGHDWDVTTGLVLSAQEYAPGDPAIPEKIAKLGGGALKITTQYNLDTQRGAEAFSDVKKGIIKQWSVGFVPDSASVRWEKGKRYIGNVLDWPEVSNVLVGASPGTMSSSFKISSDMIRDHNPKADDGDMVDCPTCKGSGKIKGGSVQCPDCKGKGQLTRDQAAALGKAARTADRLAQAKDLARLYRAWLWMVSDKSKLDTEDAREAAKYKLRDSAGKVKFPINDCSDVEDAWNLRGSSSIPKDKVESHVRSAASKLKCDGPWNDDSGKSVEEPVEWKELPTLTGDEAQHSGPMLQALDGIKVLIQQECAEDGYDEFDDIVRLCYVASDLIRWAKGEASEYGDMAYPFGMLMAAGKEALDAKAAVQPADLSDEALAALVYSMNPSEAERQSTQHNVPDDSDEPDRFDRLWPTSRPRFGELAEPTPRKPATRR